jgi:hypothetical protein
VNLLVLSPLLAIAILGAKGILHLLLSDIRLLNIAFILPFALLFIFMRSVLGFLGVAAIDDADVSVALFAGSLCFLGVSLLALKTLPKERLL